MPSALPQPERLGPYEIVETLAQGHAGWVFYKGYDSILRRSATLKTIPKKLLVNYGAAAISRLETDVQAASHLHHPGIIGIYEYGEQFDLAYIATEYLDSPNLKEHARVPLGDAVSLVTQLLSALDFAHDQGVIHRGIRPSNLVITDKGQLRIAGFGVGELDPGNPGYLSPEQYTGSAIDRRTDVFSAGIVFYELLTGVHPFAGQVDGFPSRICNSIECPPSTANPDVPRAFDRVCAKALAKAARDRYPSARAFSQGLREAYEGAIGSSPTRMLSTEATMVATMMLSEADRSNFAAARSKERPQLVSPPVGTRWEEATIRTVEKQLATFIGPVAKVKVREAANKASDLDRLYSIASESLSREDERRAFLAQRPGAAQPGVETPLQRAPAPVQTPQKPAVAIPEERKSAPDPAPLISEPLPRQESKARVPIAPAPEPRPAPVAEAKFPAPSEPKAAAKPKEMPAPKPPAVPEQKTPQPQKAPQPPAAGIAASFEGLIGKQPDTLAGYLKDSPPQVEEVIHAFQSTVQALIAFNATGAKKESLAPQNITFDRLGKATIQALQSTSTRATSSAASNPRYAAPEIFAEKSAATDSSVATSHVYALGMMFYEILLGKRLFAKTFADQRTDLDWMRWHADLESKAPSLKSMLPDYPTALSDLVESMMEKRAEKRPANLESIQSRLREIAQRANKTIVLTKKSQAKEPPRGPATKIIPAKKQRHNTWLWVLVFILALAAGGGFWLFENPDFFRTVIAPLLHLSTS
jgi:serine/threonine protein kinase